MLNQATETKKNQDEIITAPLDENKIFEIPKEKWTDFLDNVSKRRFGWETKVEIFDAKIGDHTLSEGLSLNGITHEDKTENCTIEISLGNNTEHHQTHSISKPVKITYLSETINRVGILEIIEAKGTITRISLLNPMPIVFGYAAIEKLLVY